MATRRATGSKRAPSAGTGGAGASAGTAEKAPRKRGLVAREPDRRKLTDPKVLRALAHPLRLALMEALLREGPLTASAAAAILDDSPGNMSWHLNVLAKYGFVEEAEGGRGRSRPWRLVNLGTEFDEDPDDVELDLAGEAFTRVILERNIERARQWLDERRSFPAKWRSAAFYSNSVTYLTPDELRGLGDEMTQLLNRYRERSLDRSQRPEGSRPVHVSAIGHPLVPTPSGN